jgi:hypothetical protein
MGCSPHVRFHASTPNSGVGLEAGYMATELRSGIILARNQPGVVRSFIDAPRVKGPVWLTDPVFTGK